VLVLTSAPMTCGSGQKHTGALLSVAPLIALPCSANYVPWALSDWPNTLKFHGIWARPRI